LCGHQTDVQRFYGIASIVVLPSHSEGSPNVLLEAHAAGIPVVATNVGGVPEIATNGVTALLVPKSDAGAMAQAICRLLEDPELARRIAAAGREDVFQRFTPTIHMESMLQLYSRVSGGEHL
jgi:glycosyltransferase involved in cell wall biosynthesis